MILFLTVVVQMLLVFYVPLQASYAVLLAIFQALLAFPILLPEHEPVIVAQFPHLFWLAALRPDKSPTVRESFPTPAFSCLQLPFDATKSPSFLPPIHEPWIENFKIKEFELQTTTVYHASVPVFPAQAEFLSDPANLRAKPCDYLPPPRVLFPLALPISSCLEGTSDNERVPPHSQLPPWMHSPTAIESDDRWLEIRRFFGSRITGTCYDAWTRGSSTGTWKWSPEWFPLGIARRWEFHRVFPSLMYPNRRPKPVKVTRWKHNSIKLVSWNYA